MTQFWGWIRWGMSKSFLDEEASMAGVERLTRSLSSPLSKDRKVGKPISRQKCRLSRRMETWLKDLGTAASFVRSTRNDFIQLPIISVYVLHLICDFQGAEDHSVCHPKRIREAESPPIQGPGESKQRRLLRGERKADRCRCLQAFVNS